MAEFTSMEKIIGSLHAAGGRNPLAAVLVILVVQVACALCVFYTGGTRFVFTHSMYLPVIFAAAMYKKAGGIAAGFTGGLLLGPWMPLNTITGEMQETINWLYRTVFFIGIGALTGYIFHALERKNAELEQRVQERTRQLEYKNQEMEAFAYSVSHDLRAPLRGIDGYSRLLLEEYSDRLNDEGRTFLQKIRKSSSWMNQLVDDILAYARLERYTWDEERVQARDLVLAILDLKRQDIMAIGATVSVNVPDNIILFTDVSALEMILRNLLDNAIKFTKNVEKPEIEISISESEGAFLASVRDNGIGFDEQYADKIFEIFQRLHRLEDYPGSGVGLAMVRKAAERMGGTVWAKSKPGFGAAFYLKIPK